MNKIYKTMLNASTGECVATSELAKGQGKSATVSKTNATHLRGGERGIRYKNTLLSTVIGVTLFSAFGNHAVARPLVYDGTGHAGTASIKQASDTTVFGAEGLPAWLSINPTDEGVVYLDDAGKPVLTGAELKVEHTSGTTPKFVIGGYSASGEQVENNSVNVNQGNVEGDVFGGLSHITNILADVTGKTSGYDTSVESRIYFSDSKVNADNNKVIIADGSAVNGNVYGGATVNWFQSGNATAGGDVTLDSVNFASAGSRSHANANRLMLTANDNTVTVGDGSQVSGAIYGGYTQISMKSGEIKSSDVQATIALEFPAETIEGRSYYYSTEAYALASNDDSIVNANGNIVTVSDGSQVGADIYGGYAQLSLQAEDANSGNVNMTSAGNPSNAQLSGDSLNMVLIDNSTLTASNNAVTVGDGSLVGGGMHGGHVEISSQAGNANSENGYEMNITSYYMTNYVKSNTSVEDSTLTTNSNTVMLGDSSMVEGSMFGGDILLSAEAGRGKAGDMQSSNADDINPELAESYADAFAEVRAWHSTVNANSNTVIVGSGSQVGGSMYGGYVQLSAKAGEVKAGDVLGLTGFRYVRGGSYGNASATANDLTLIANRNTVIVGDVSQIRESIYGGYAQSSVKAGEVNAGNTTISYNRDEIEANATVIIDTKAHALTDVFSTEINASNNTVTVGKGSQIGGFIYGGYTQLNAQAGEANAGSATIFHNGDYVEPGVFFSAKVLAIADASVTIKNTNITASNNTVTVGKGSQVGDSIYGGYAGLTAAAGKATAGLRNGVQDISSAAVNASNSQVLANDNTVTFDGILLTGDIVGGHTVFDITQGTVMGDNPLNDNSVDLTGSKAQATGNTVTIGDDAQFNASTSSLYGGSIQYNAVGNFKPESYDTFTGNTLNWSAKAPATFTRVGNFEHMNFTLNPVYANTDVALISATDIVLGTDGSNMSDGSNKKSQISVVGIHSGNILQAGDEFILMNATNPLSGSGAVDTTAPNVAQQGISLLYDVDVNIKSNQVTATIQSCQTSSGEECHANGGGNGPQINPSLKSLLEGNLAAALLVTRGADVIANEVLGTINEQNHKNGLVPFVLISGDHIRYNTGSHIKSNDTILTGGLSYQEEKLTLGVFAESGWGRYDTYNNVDHAANVKGEGNARYYGIGVLGHYAFDNGFYTDGALRTGKAHNNFSSDLINIASGESAHYTLNNHYVSAHLAVGYLFALDDKNDLDLSAKYLYSTLSGKQAIVAGDPIRFDRINSSRVRLNASVNHQSNANVTLNAGLGYEHEFDGKAKGTTYRVYNIDAPSVEGGTGIMSFGAHIQPTENKNLTLDFDGKVYVGKREGIGGTLRVNYAF